jgi:hypothetical protein
MNTRGVRCLTIVGSENNFAEDTMSFKFKKGESKMSKFGK